MVTAQGRNLSLAIVCGLAFGALSWRVDFGGAPLTLYFIQFNQAVASGWVWQLLTSILVATPSLPGLVDVAFNALAVLWLDRMFEGAYSPKAYYATFVVTGVAGNVLSLVSGPTLVSFGASGGIFGLLAGAISEDYASRRRVNFGLMIWFLLIFVMSSFALAYVDWYAHLGGALAGAAIGYYLGTHHSPEL